MSPRMALLFLLGLIASANVGLSSAYRHHRSEQGEFLAPQPKEVLSTDGGRVESWEADEFSLLKKADLVAAVITLESKSLLLPKYSDSASLLYVLEGTAWVGLISPFGINTNVRTIKQGDVWAIPRGWAHWIWNTENEVLRLIGVAETSTVPLAGIYQPFHLIGGQEDHTGGLLNGFSKETLDQAWDVEVEDVEKLLESQKQTGIIKLDIEESPRFVPTKPAASFFGDFIYNLDEAQPDVVVKNGGVLRQLNVFKLPILRKVGLGLTRLHLKPGAIVAPQFLTNAHRLIYITKGKGRVEIAYPDGRNALDAEVQTGDLVLVPPGFASVESASDDEELHYVSFAGSELPIPAFLAGGNSLFSALPRKVRNAAFNIDEELGKKFEERRRHEFAIFPKREGKNSHLFSGRKARKWEENGVASLAQDLERFVLDAQRAVETEMGLALN